MKPTRHGQHGKSEGAGGGGCPCRQRGIIRRIDNADVRNLNINHVYCQHACLMVPVYKHVLDAKKKKSPFNATFGGVHSQPTRKYLHQGCLSTDAEVVEVFIGLSGGVHQLLGGGREGVVLSSCRGPHNTASWATCGPQAVRCRSLV